MENPTGSTIEAPNEAPLPSQAMWLIDRSIDLLPLPLSSSSSAYSLSIACAAWTRNKKPTSTHINSQKTYINSKKTSINSQKTYTNSGKTYIDSKKTSINSQKTYIDSGKTYVNWKKNLHHQLRKSYVNWKKPTSTSWEKTHDVNWIKNLHQRPRQRPPPPLTKDELSLVYQCNQHEWEGELEMTRRDHCRSLHQLPHTTSVSDCSNNQTSLQTFFLSFLPVVA